MSIVMSRKNRKGFTLVELAVVIVIIGVLAAFGVPKFINSVERSKAAEAFSYLTAVRSAQERYIAREGTYATDPSQLDIQFAALKYFSNPATITVTNQNAWTFTLTRTGASAGYGAYTVTFTDAGYDGGNSTIDGYPAINPMGTDPAGGTSSGS
jgi:prepilin-type N-terminal cleavage/methylation domain-containing protein